MTKMTIFAGALAAATLSTITSASAHSASAVQDKLERRGYSRIEFTDATPPNYMANACRDGVRYHFHVNYYGDVTERREIGSCGIRAEHHDRYDRYNRDSRVHEVQPYQPRRYGGWRWWQRRHSANDWN
jgi:hypothetical protein